MTPQHLDDLAALHGITLTPDWRAALLEGSRIAHIYADRVRLPAA